jgi:DNA-binding IclR family transcriptional regulator
MIKVSLKKVAMDRTPADGGASAEPPAANLENSPVVKALRLIAHLADAREPVPLSELTRALVLPKATIHRLAGLLEAVGYLQKNPLTLRYSLGAQFEEVARAARRSCGAHRRRLMNELSGRLGVRTNFAVLKAGRMIEWLESSSPARIDSKPHSHRPAHCCASGKLLLAFAPPELRERFLAAAPFRPFTRSTITAADTLRRELAAIRRRGWAEDNQEFMQGITCLAVPVRDRSGSVVAGLAVMAPAHDFPLARARDNIAAIQACADAISAEAE